MQLSLTCFGTGDGVGIADRNHSAYLYTFGETNLLVDCGEPISRTFKASRLSYETIDAIFLSHLHSDHFAGLFMLLQSSWLEQRQKPLPIYLPADAIQPLRQMLQAAYLFPEALPFALNFVPLQIRNGDSLSPLTAPIIFGPAKVTPCLTSHLEKARLMFERQYPGDYHAFCFLLETENLRLGHTADLGAPEDLEPLLARPLDLLVCELAHVKPETMFCYLKGRPIRRILFTHVARYEWEHLPELKRAAREILKGMDFSFARDGEKIVLSEM